MQLLMTPEGKKIKVSMQEDICLYSSPRNPPNTGTSYTSGTDLYYHKARSKKVYYYTYFWSMWQGTEDSYELVTADEAIKFILERAVRAGHVGGGVREANCRELWGEDFFEEDEI